MCKPLFNSEVSSESNMNDECRVLNRRGAHQLTYGACEQVQGAFIINTAVCTIHVNSNGTCTFEADCEPVPRCHQG